MQRNIPAKSVTLSRTYRKSFGLSYAEVSVISGTVPETEKNNGKETKKSWYISE